MPSIPSCVMHKITKSLLKITKSINLFLKYDSIYSSIVKVGNKIIR